MKFKQVIPIVPVPCDTDVYNEALDILSQVNVIALGIDENGWVWELTLHAGQGFKWTKQLTDFVLPKPKK